MHIATKSSKIDISSEQKTEIISKKFSKYLKKGDIIFLFGEIGVGKTTFIKYLINHLQIKNNLIKTEVPSPTFNILNEYEINGLVIHHYDLFKLKDSNEIKNIGLFENYSSIITFVEWPEIIEKKPKKFSNKIKKEIIKIGFNINKKSSDYVLVNNSASFFM